METMNRSLSTILALLFVWGCGAAAGEGPDRSSVVFEDNCGACHAPNGQGNKAFNAPSIAGLPYWYVLAQLEKFRDGVRGAHADDVDGLRMRPMARALKEDDVKHVSAYVARMAPKQGVHEDLGGDATRGKDLYVTCTACHGTDGMGNETLSAPPIVRLDSWYAEAQLHKFRNDIRGANPRDITGRQMAPMAKTLTDDQAVKDVLAYIATLPPQP
jgi:cytochrome c553